MADVTISDLPNLAPSSSTYVPISNGTITGKTLSSSIGMPIGIITLWSNYNGQGIPAGWALCDGQGGRPDLRNRFIVGSGDLYAIGNTGGADSVALTVDQIPSHNHTINDPGHSHSAAVITSGTLACANLAPRAGSGSTSTNTTGITLNSTGGSLPHENRPPYYALAYIIKVN